MPLAVVGLDGLVPIATGEQTVTLRDGTVLWTTTSGNGCPLVLCHGGPGLWDYLGPLAALLDDRVTAIRFDQRGCGRSGGATGPFTIARAVADLEQLRAALGIETWAVLGHSWGAELALRYAARHPEHTELVVYVSGVGGDQAYAAPYEAERVRRLGADQARWLELRARSRTSDEEREWCLLQWRADFAPTPHARGHAEALWATRPPGARVNAAARALWLDREQHDLIAEAATVRCPVRLLHGAEDPRPWTVTGPVLRAVPDARRTVLDGAGHAPWAERPAATRAFVLAALAEIA